LSLDEIQKSVFDTFEVSKSVGVCVGAYAFIKRIWSLFTHFSDFWISSIKSIVSLN
jgi:hypothetical protein